MSGIKNTPHDVGIKKRIFKKSPLMNTKRNMRDPRAVRR